jgi:dTMP kinase
MGAEHHDDPAIEEIERERDVAIARARDAEERERLALDRLRALASLEARVEAAERRALDAERRLEEIAAQLSAAAEASAQPARFPARSDGEHEDDPEEPDAAARQTADLRARLARTAGRKKPSPPPG